MFDFTYHMKFKVLDNKLNISLFLSLEDYFTPVYSRAVDKDVFNDKIKFQKIYREIQEYLENSNLIINTEELKLLYQTLTDFNIPLPALLTVTLDQYDSFLDDYEYLLTPKEIVFLIFANELAINDKRFANWEKENHLDVEYHLDLLIKKGYLTTDDYLKNIRKANRDQLLYAVNKYNLDVRGDNNDLIREIIKQLTDEQLSECFKGSHFALTEKGAKIVRKSTKIDDFHKSYYRYASNLKIEEFHLIAIRKSEYDFIGVCKLIMVNTNKNTPEKTKYFDWNSIFEKKVEIDNIEIKKDELTSDSEEVSSDDMPSDKEFLDLISRVSANFNHDEVDRKQDSNDTYQVDFDKHEERLPSQVNSETVAVENKADVKSEVIEAPYDIDENYKISQSINSYQKRKARYEEHGEIITENEFSKIKHRKSKKGLWVLLFLLFLAVVVVSLFYYDILVFEEMKELINEYFEKAKNYVNKLLK